MTTPHYEDALEEKEWYQKLSMVDRTYLAYEDSMWTMYDEGRNEESIERAKWLLDQADLPDLLRARCNMRLAMEHSGTEAVWHARNAVEILVKEKIELGITVEQAKLHLDLAKQYLKEAEDDEHRSDEDLETHQYLELSFPPSLIR